MLHLVVTASFCLVVRPPLSSHDVDADADALVAHLPPRLSAATTFNGRPTRLPKRHRAAAISHSHRCVAMII
jgi:hypothetical protein